MEVAQRAVVDLGERGEPASVELELRGGDQPAVFEHPEITDVDAVLLAHGAHQGRLLEVAERVC